MSNTAGVI